MYRIVLACLLSIAPALSHADEDVAAKVNGAVISVKEVEAEANRIMPRTTYHGNIPEEKRNEFRNQALERLIDRELQYQDALAKGMKPDKKQVKAQMKQVRDKFASKKEYRAALDRSGLTEDGLQARIEKAVLVQAAVVKMVTEPSQVSDAELKEYYDKNTEKFRQPASARLRLITIQDEKKAREALRKVRQGEDFGNVAAAMSEDDYRIKGGDIGYIHRGRLLPELEDAAFKLKTGEVTDALHTRGTWFIIKAEDVKPEHQLTFDEAKDKLKQDLEKKRGQELMEKWLTELRAKAKIERLVEGHAAGDGLQGAENGR